MKKVLPALALALLLLSGCATTQAQINSYNATLYVQGLLDETYTGNPQEGYLKLMDLDNEAVAEGFEKNLEAEYSERLAVRFELEDQYLTNTTREEFLELLRQVYAKAEYSVKAAVPLDDSRYCVEVTVTPVTFFQGAYADGFDKLAQDFAKNHPQPDEERWEEMTPARQRQLKERDARAWAQEVYDYLYARLDAVTTGAPVTKLVLVSPDSEGKYALSATDFRDLDDNILLY